MARLLAAGLLLLVLLAGCQSSGQEPAGRDETPGTTAEPGPGTTGERPSTTSDNGQGTTAPPGGTTDEATMEAVVRAWSESLNAEENEALARLFAPPVVVAQAGVVVELTTFDVIAEWFAGLPCSGTVASIAYEADVAVAVFVLGHRPTSRCDAAPGELAAARFVFRDGKLIGWEQVPVPADVPPAATQVEA